MNDHLSEADSKKLGYVGKTPGKSDRKSNDWFTPKEYLDSVRASLGGTIGLDPFSSDDANKEVKAVRYYTEKDDAFKQSWVTTSVFMNPPYSGKLVSLATAKFMDEFKNGSFQSGIFLVNNSTETKWFQRALAEAEAVCFTNHRISFWNTDGKKISGNTRGQAFFLFGTDNFSLFQENFTKHGSVLKIKR